jgi:hypothetical protein
MRALAALRTVWVSAAWMAVEMLATWCVRKLRGDARPSPYRVLSVAPGRRVWRARRRRIVMTRGCERASGFGDE